MSWKVFRLAVSLAMALFAIVLAVSQVEAADASPSRCAGERFAITRVPGGMSPYIELTIGEKTGLFLLDYGTTRSSVSRSLFSAGAPVDGKPLVAGVSMPSFASGRFDVVSYSLLDHPPGGQYGIIGTDFLSLLTADFSFRGADSDVVIGAAPCSNAELRARGMIPVRQNGVFSRDLKTIAPGNANVPVLYVAVAGVSAPAQIDTGYDDRRLPPSIDINEALFQRITAAGGLLQPHGEITMATCSGAATNTVYTAPQTKITLQTDDGTPIQVLNGVSLIRKRPNGCGGIADKTEPAAQLGMSILAGLHAVVFDPSASLVWVPAAR